MDASAAYVAISRARTSASIYTDSRARLMEVIGLRDGAPIGAIDEVTGKITMEGLEVGGCVHNSTPFQFPKRERSNREARLILVSAPISASLR